MRSNVKKLIVNFALFIISLRMAHSEDETFLNQLDYYFLKIFVLLFYDFQTLKIVLIKSFPQVMIFFFFSALLFARQLIYWSFTLR